MSGDTHDDTSIRTRAAVAGDAGSLAWIVERFSPMLLIQAEYRLPPRLRGLYAPEDLVQDVWLRVLGRLDKITPGDTPFARALLSYVSTALLRRIRDLAEKHFKGKPEQIAPEHDLSENATGVVSRAVRGERQETFRMAMAALEDKDREVLVLRSIEQRSLADTAALLELPSSTVAVRHHRAKKKLKAWAELLELDG